MLTDPTPSPPLAGDSVAEFRASLPGDLFGISIEPLAESTHGAGEIVTEVSPPAVSVFPSCCSEDSDVPLAVLAKVASAVGKMDSHGGEGLPPLLRRLQKGRRLFLPSSRRFFVGREQRVVLELRGSKANVVSCHIVVVILA